MFGHEVASLAAIVGKVRVLCELCIPDTARQQQALALLDEAEALLTGPNGDSDQREKWREQKRAQRTGRLSADVRELSADVRELSADMSADTVGVGVEEGAEGEVGVEEGAAPRAVATPTPARANHTTEVGTVYAHWRTYHPRAAATLPSTARDYRLAVVALKNGHTVASLCTSIDGYHRSPYHCGDNDKGLKYQGLDLILRDEAHITRGIEMAADPLIDRGMSARERRGVSAGQAWLDEMAEADRQDAEEGAS